jgi:hypothetical protein
MGATLRDRIATNSVQWSRSSTRIFRPEDSLLCLLTRARHMDYNISKLLNRNYKDS